MTMTALVIGLGQIGLGYDTGLDRARFVQTHSRAMSTHPGFSLLGGVDPHPDRRTAFVQSYGVPAYASLEQLPANAAPDVVIVATGTEVHDAVIATVLELMRPKAILCEKPLSYDPVLARRTTDACAAAGVPLFVNFMRRADPGAIEIKRRVDAGELAPPFRSMVWYSKGFLHSASHFVDLLTFWFGHPVGGKVLALGRPRGAYDGEPDVSLSFGGGSAVFLAVREEAFAHHTLELVASNGRLRYDRGGELIEWQSVAPHPRLANHATIATIPEHIPSDMNRFQANVAQQLAAALDGLDHHLCTGRDALQTLELMHAILTENTR